jgi:phosphoribosylglycinamide formyltransferase 1
MHEAKRIVVLISGSGSNMVAVDDACKRSELPGQIVAVISDRLCPGIATAQRRDIETFVLEPGHFTTRLEWSTALRDIVAPYEPDLVVSAGFMRILAGVFVDAFAGRLINLHPALLPAFPGAHAVRDALQAGVRVTGSTVHFVDHLVDHGPIILQQAVEVRDGDTQEELHLRIKQVEHHLLPRACRLILEGKVRMEHGRVHVASG